MNPSLESRLAPLAQAHAGKVSVAVKHLDTGESYTLNPDEPLPTASLIKFPIMVDYYFQVAEGKLRPNELCILQSNDKVPGSGILTDHFSVGAAFPLRDAVRLMIVYSDNTATNIVLDHTGIPPVNDRMESLGLPNTKIHSKVYKRTTSSINLKRSEKFGLGSTSANEMIRLLDKLHKGELVNKTACDEMLGHLKKCEDPDKFPRFLPYGTVVAMKTGSVSDARTVAGIIYVKKQPVACCVMTAENKDKSYHPDNAGDLLCAKVAKEVFDYFNK